MVSKNQAGSDGTAYQSSKDRHICEWDDDTLTNLVPMHRECAIEYWNAVNRHRDVVSQDVINHFKSQMQQFK